MKNNFISLLFPLKYREFALQIRDDSEESFLTERESEIILHAKKIIIDLHACQERKGKKLTDNEKEFLFTRHLRQEGVHTWRLGNKIYLEKTRGTSRCEVHLPMKMMDQIKENARIRNKTISQMFVEMADYYLLTFGDATDSIHEYIAQRQDDLHYQTGGMPELGVMGSKRTKNPYRRPDYPLSMTLDKMT